MQNLASTESQTIHRLLEMGGDMNNTGNYSNYDQVQDELYNETMAAEETAKEEEQRNMEETRKRSFFSSGRRGMRFVYVCRIV